MDHYTALRRQVTILCSVIFVGLFGVSLACFMLLRSIDASEVVAIATIFLLFTCLAIIGSYFFSDLALRPLHTVWRNVIVLSEKSQEVDATSAEQLKLGRELTTNLLLQLYQLTSTVAAEQSSNRENLRTAVIQSANIVSHMPIPLFVFNKDLLVTNASNVGLEYCEVDSSELFGKNLSQTINMEFSSDQTLDSWIKDCIGNKVVDTAYWERVRIVLQKNNKVIHRRCDMAAYYNRGNPSGTEFIITMFDRTEQYQNDDNSMSFVALAVHELRTPLTMLRGYIEVFVDELDGKLDDELKGFLQKMDLSARQLNDFVGSILNVSKVDENELTLHLSKANWKEVLEEAVHDLQLKAKLRNKNLILKMDGDIPDVAIDRIGILEVINNLVDNAIKYSGESKDIVISSSVSKDGFIETTVEDKGVGIPENVVTHIFEKFYRNHRTKANISGSGLGLYLARSLVNAHGGQIWVSSKVGEGSTFGFSLQPYTMVEAAQKESGEDKMTRTAHGWIKNHSLYRR